MLLVESIFNKEIHRCWCQLVHLMMEANNWSS